MEKPLRGKPKPGFPLRLEIPQHRRDSHFPTATTADITSPTFEPSKLPSPCVASRSSISAPPGGYDVTRLFHPCPWFGRYSRPWYSGAAPALSPSQFLPTGRSSS